MAKALGLRSALTVQLILDQADGRVAAPTGAGEDHHHTWEPALPPPPPAEHALELVCRVAGGVVVSVSP